MTEIASTGSYVRAEIGFSGLPPAAGARSCAGFVLDPTPVETRTWSRIKMLYRAAEP